MSHDPIFGVQPGDEPAPPPPGPEPEPAAAAPEDSGWFHDPDTAPPRRARRAAAERDESLEHFLQIVAGVMRSTMAPDAPAWSSAWIPTEAELAAMTRGAAFGAERAGVGPALDEYGPAIAAAAATFGYVTRSMRETRAYREAAALSAAADRAPAHSPAPRQESPANADDPPGGPGADEGGAGEPAPSLDPSALAAISDRISFG